MIGASECARCGSCSVVVWKGAGTSSCHQGACGVSWMGGGRKAAAGAQRRPLSLLRGMATAHTQMSVCVCVCERERDTQSEWHVPNKGRVHQNSTKSSQPHTPPPSPSDQHKPGCFVPVFLSSLFPSPLLLSTFSYLSLSPPLFCPSIGPGLGQTALQTLRTPQALLLQLPPQSPGRSPGFSRRSRLFESYLSRVACSGEQISCKDLGREGETGGG